MEARVSLTGCAGEGTGSAGGARGRTPTLVLHGSSDTLINPIGGRRTAEAIPGARYVEFEGMGHDYPEAYWDEWVALIAEHALGVERVCAEPDPSGALGQHARRARTRPAAIAPLHQPEDIG